MSICICGREIYGPSQNDIGECVGCEQERNLDDPDFELEQLKEADQLDALLQE